MLCLLALLLYFCLYGTISTYDGRDVGRGGSLLVRITSVGIVSFFFFVVVVVGFVFVSSSSVVSSCFCFYYVGGWVESGSIKNLLVTGPSSRLVSVHIFVFTKENFCTAQNYICCKPSLVDTSCSRLSFWFRLK